MISIGISIRSILIILLLTSIAASLTIPSDNNKPVVSEEVRELLGSGSSRVTTASATGTSGTGSGRGDGGRDDGRPAVISTGDIIQIKKRLIPASDDGYLVGDSVGVFIEVRCKQNLNAISIKEFVDSDLNIINTSKYAYRLVTSDEISDYEGRFNNDYFKDYDPVIELNTRDGKIHPNDKNQLIIGGSDCIYDYKRNINYQHNLMQFLGNRLRVSWAENASTILRENELNIYDRNNNSCNITISFDKKKEFATLKFKNDTYKFIIKCDSMHCPIEKPIQLGSKMNSTALYAKDVLFNFSIYNLQNDFDINIVNPRMNERYTYWYFVKLSKPGKFDAITNVLTSQGGFRNVPDIDSSMNIKVADPSPEVNVRLNKLHLLKNEEFDIVYQIRDATQLNNHKTVCINFPSENDYYSFVNKTSNGELEQDCSVRVRLNENNLVNIEKTLKYYDSGEYYLPGITINGEYFPFQKEKVIVSTRFETYAQFITLISGIIAFFLKDTLLQGKAENESKTRRKIRYLTILILILGIVILLFWFSMDKPILFLP
jgi:hypothetical protein